MLPGLTIFRVLSVVLQVERAFPRIVCVVPVCEGSKLRPWIF
jgi:hypothetical protein